MNFKKIKINTKLLRLGFFNSLSLVISSILGIASTKVLAFGLGVQEFGLFGVYREFLKLMTNVATLGITFGIIKYVSEQKNNDKDLSEFFSNLFSLALLSAIFIGIGLVLLAPFLSIYLFKTSMYAPEICALGGVVFFIVIFGYLVAIYKGLGKKKIAVIVSIVNAFSLLLLYGILVPKIGLVGAMWASILVFPISVGYLLLNFPKRYRITIRFGLKKKVLTNLSVYAGMALFSLLAFPWVNIVIRNTIQVYEQQQALGYWEALTKISQSYTMFGYSLLSLFVLPKIAENCNYENYKNTIKEFLTTIFPFYMLLILLIYIFKDFFIRVVLSDDYLTIIPWLKWFMIGDIFRMAAQLFGTYFHASRGWKQYLFIDVILVSLQYLLINSMIKEIGLKGGAIAYCICFVVYFIITLLVLSRMDFYSKRNTVVKQ